MLSPRDLKDNDNKGGYICVPSFVSFMEGNNMDIPIGFLG